jgi:hypothetical protein
MMIDQNILSTEGAKKASLQELFQKLSSSQRLVWTMWRSPLSCRRREPNLSTSPGTS